MMRALNNQNSNVAVRRDVVSLLVKMVLIVIVMSDSTFAASLLTTYSVSSAELLRSLETRPNDIGSAAEPVIGINEGTSNRLPAPTAVGSPWEPIQIDPHNQPDFALVHGSTRSNASPPGSTLSRRTHAVLNVTHPPPVSTYLGRLQLEISLDIPVAPPFELLRPPQS